MSAEEPVEWTDDKGRTFRATRAPGEVARVDITMRVGKRWRHGWSLEGRGATLLVEALRSAQAARS